MIQQKAKIKYNRNIAHTYWHCAIKSAQIAEVAKPGQFVMIKVTDSGEPLLRRPLGIHNVNSSTKEIEVLYEVVGQGTQLLAKKKPGDQIDIIGPLGNGFDYQLPITDYQLPILIAGGMGVAPLLFLAKELIKNGGKPLVLLGAKTKQHILCEKEFIGLGCAVKIATDDGSRGFKGFVTDLLRKALRTPNSELPTLYACGPAPMLKEISKIARAREIPAQISLEAHMACGLGVCLGCAVKVKSQKSKGKSGFEYQRVCKDGPVFEAKNVVWE